MNLIAAAFASCFNAWFLFSLSSAPVTDYSPVLCNFLILSPERLLHCIHIVWIDFNRNLQIVCLHSRLISFKCSIFYDAVFSSEDALVCEMQKQSLCVCFNCSCTVCSSGGIFPFDAVGLFKPSHFMKVKAFRNKKQKAKYLLSNTEPSVPNARQDSGTSHLKGVSGGEWRPTPPPPPPRLNFVTSCENSCCSKRTKNRN